MATITNNSRSSAATVTNVARNTASLTNNTKNTAPPRQLIGSGFHLLIGDGYKLSIGINIDAQITNRARN
jgi:hypothetical protein